ncbi:MAG: hypothetical protein A3E88_05125 [Legionellales bacterium RIFCSPHIGHO2_12_FULL_35_11]|nr:MAG: hypothetical protein A3E88_05125 [Legionellales bacterium RIFCSPHIGHO2_12_FULL_35_11]
MKKYLFFIILSIPFAWKPVYAIENPVLKNINGATFEFSSLKGKWVFINYWASWCGPCVDEISEFNKLFDEKNNNVAIYAVNYDFLSLSQQQNMANKFQIHYPSLEQKSALKLGLGNISVVPVTFIFNPEGKLTATLYGGQTIQGLKKEITDQELLLKQHA